MRLAISLGLVLALRLASAADIVGHWTLYNLWRTCGHDAGHLERIIWCVYNFEISESPESDAPRTPCTVTANSSSGGQTDPITFSDHSCRQGGPAAIYNISNGYDPEGFVTLTVLNHNFRENAFFSYPDGDLTNGYQFANKTEPAYRVGKPSSALGKRNVWEELEVAGSGAACDPSVWIVKNLSRNARPIVQAVLIRFNLFRCDDGTHCGFDTFGENLGVVDIQYDNFTDVPCDDAKNLHVSWGYKPDTDGGVMTVEDTDLRRRAFFGWDHVNGGVKIDEESQGRWEAY